MLAWDSTGREKDLSPYRSHYTRAISSALWLPTVTASPASGLKSSNGGRDQRKFSPASAPASMANAPPPTGRAAPSEQHMTELKGKKRQQPTSCPQDWLPDARVVQLELTCRQERYAQRCVGVARFVYNRMVANDQAGREVGLWLTPHELEKEFNAVKQTNPSLGFATQVSKFVAQGACRNYRNAHSRWRNKNIRARKPTFHKKNRTGTGSFLAASGVDRIGYDGHRRIRLPYLGSVRMTRPLPEGIPHEVTLRKQNGR